MCSSYVHSSNSDGSSVLTHGQHISSSKHILLQAAQSPPDLQWLTSMGERLGVFDGVCFLHFAPSWGEANEDAANAFKLSRPKNSSKQIKLAYEHHWALNMKISSSGTWPGISQHIPSRQRGWLSKSTCQI